MGVEGQAIVLAVAVVTAGCQSRVDLGEGQLDVSEPPVIQVAASELAKRYPFPESPPSVARGRELFEGLPALPAAFRDATILRTTRPADLFTWISEGRPDDGFPGLAESFTPQQRWDLVVYLREAALGPGQLEAGQAVFEMNCVLCHGPQGLGDGPGGASLHPKPRNFQDLRLMAGKTTTGFFEVVTSGKGPMPAWGELLSEEERWQAVDYLWTFMTLERTGEGEHE